MMDKCRFCGKTFSRRAVVNAHIGKEHKKDVEKMKKEWAKMRSKGMTTKEIAAKSGVHALTVSKHLKKIRPDEFHQFKRLMRA